MAVDNSTPSLSTLLRRTMREAIKGLYTFMPGKVVEYDHTKQEAVVQPTLKIELPDDPATGQRRTAQLPLIPNVPVRWPRVGGEAGTIKAYMYMPMCPGSLVGLFFSMRSIDKWLSSDGQTVIDPNDTRTMDIADAFAVPGFYPTEDPIPNVDDDDVRIILDHPTSGFSEFYLGGDTGDVVALPARDFRIGNKDATEHGVLGDTLKNELDTLAQSFIDNAATIVQTGVGPGSLNPTVVTALTTFISNLVNILSTDTGGGLKLI